jgi:hypothetical protein
MNHGNHLSAMDERIDSTLRLIGSADPRPGLENRIVARLAQAPAGKSARFFALPGLAFASAALAASVAIVVGSVNHSQRILPVAPGVQLSGGSLGVGTVSGARVAPKPVAAPSGGRARSMRKPGIEPGPQKGVAVPKGPLPQADPKPQPR